MKKNVPAILLLINSVLAFMNFYGDTRLVGIVGTAAGVIGVIVGVLLLIRKW